MFNGTCTVLRRVQRSNRLFLSDFKYYLFGQGNLLYICNTISPKIVDLFSEIMNMELFVIYFDYREYDPDFARTHVKNGLV